MMQKERARILPVPFLKAIAVRRWQVIRFLYGPETKVVEVLNHWPPTNEYRVT